jgi:hypothetical protein
MTTPVDSLSPVNASIAGTPILEHPPPIIPMPGMNPEPTPNNESNLPEQSDEISMTDTADDANTRDGCMPATTPSALDADKPAPDGSEPSIDTTTSANNAASATKPDDNKPPHATSTINKPDLSKPAVPVSLSAISGTVPATTSSAGGTLKRPTGFVLSSLPNSPSFRPLSSITVTSRPTSSAGIRHVVSEDLRKRRAAEAIGALIKQVSYSFHAILSVILIYLPIIQKPDIKRPRLVNAVAPVLTPVIPRGLAKTSSSERSEHTNNQEISAMETTTSDDTKSPTSTSAQSSSSASYQPTPTSDAHDTAQTVSKNTSDEKGEPSEPDPAPIEEYLDVARLYKTVSDSSAESEPNQEDQKLMRSLARWERIPIGVFRSTRRRRNSLPTIITCTSAVKSLSAVDCTLVSNDLNEFNPSFFELASGPSTPSSNHNTTSSSNKTPISSNVNATNPSNTTDTTTSRQTQPTNFQTDDNLLAICDLENDQIDADLPSAALHSPNHAPQLRLFDVSPISTAWQPN